MLAREPPAELWVLLPEVLAVSVCPVVEELAVLDRSLERSQLSSSPSDERAVMGAC